MKRVFPCLACLLLLFMTFLLPCAASNFDLDTDVSYYQQFRGKGVSLYVYNWGEYISEDDGSGTFDVNKEFEALTGIKVIYTTFSSNEELYAKLKSGGTIRPLSYTKFFFNRPGLH